MLPDRNERMRAPQHTRDLYRLLMALCSLCSLPPPTRRRRPSAAERPGTPTSIEEGSTALQAQRRLTELLIKSGDGKHWSARLYTYFLEQAEALSADTAAPGPKWLRPVLTRCQQAYIRNLRRWLGQSPGVPAQPWQHCFCALDLATLEGVHPSLTAAAGVPLILRAGLELDLPSALAEEYLAAAPQGCSYHTFYADAAVLTKAVQESVRRLLLELAEQALPHTFSFCARVLPTQVTDVFLRHQLDTVSRLCEDALCQGARLIEHAV